MQQKVAKSKASSRPSLHRSTDSLSSVAQLPTPASEENDDSESGAVQHPSTIPGVKIRLNLSPKPSGKRKSTSSDSKLPVDGPFPEKLRRSEPTSPKKKDFRPARMPATAIATASTELNLTKGKKRARLASPDQEDANELEDSDSPAEVTAPAKKKIRRKRRGAVASSATKDEAEFTTAKPKSGDTVSNGTRTSGRIRAPTKKFDVSNKSKVQSSESKQSSKRASDPEQVVVDSIEGPSTADTSFASSREAIEVRGSSPVVQDSDEVESESEPEPEPVAPVLPAKVISKKTKAKEPRQAVEPANSVKVKEVRPLVEPKKGRVPSVSRLVLNSDI